MPLYFFIRLLEPYRTIDGRRYFSCRLPVVVATGTVQYKYEQSASTSTIAEIDVAATNRIRIPLCRLRH
jgi:hypothetical protein